MIFNKNPIKKILKSAPVLIDKDFANKIQGLIYHNNKNLTSFFMNHKYSLLLSAPALILIIVLGIVLFPFNGQSVNNVLAEAINNTFTINNNDNFNYQKIKLYDYFLQENLIFEIWEKGKNLQVNIASSNEENVSVLQSDYDKMFCSDINFKDLEKDPRSDDDVDNYLMNGGCQEIEVIDPFFNEDNRVSFLSGTEGVVENIKLINENNDLFLTWNSDLEKSSFNIDYGYDGYKEGGTNGLDLFDENSNFYKINLSALISEHEAAKVLIQINYNDKYSNVYEVDFIMESINKLSNDDLSELLDRPENKDFSTELERTYEMHFAVPIKILEIKDQLDKPLVQEENKINNIKTLYVKYLLPENIVKELELDIEEGEVSKDLYIEFTINADDNRIMEYTLTNLNNDILEQVEIEEEKIIENIAPEKFFTEEYWRESIN